MRWMLWLWLMASAVCWHALAVAEDFESETRVALRQLQDAMPAFDELMNAGDFDGAMAKLLAVYPEAGRTPAQSFMLGNTLYEIDRKLSYALHKAAAEAAPENLQIVWEWALEQHRAGQYVEALALYRKYSQARPERAVSYALQADCLLRLNRANEAIDAWKKSEDAPVGDIETMETIVCAIHRKPAPDKRRAELLAKAVKERDVEAAAELIALDCEFPRDWWNSGVNQAYLSHDLPAVTAALGLPNDDVRLRSLKCAAECAAALEAGDESEAKIKGILAKYALLVNDAKTLPAPGALIPCLLRAAVSGKAINESDVKKDFGPKLLALARKSKDPELWNTALYASLPGDAAGDMKLEREAFAVTGNAKFAVGLLLVKQTDGKLTGKDADLAPALAQFPEDCTIQRIAYETAKRENNVTMDLLASAARAEFTHFSSYMAFATIVDRPRAGYLRGYFAELLKMRTASKL